MRLRHTVSLSLLLLLTSSLVSCRFIDDQLYAGSTPIRRGNTGNSIHSEDRYEALRAQTDSAPVSIERSYDSGLPADGTEVEIVEEPLPYDLVQAPQPQRQTPRPGNLPRGQDFWSIDIEAALREARDTGLPLFLYFCGSDWSEDCQKLDRQLFGSRVFDKFANNEVVPVRIDFPRLINFTAVHTAQNKRLKHHYDVHTYPTIVLLQADGTYIARLGYEELPPSQFIETFRRLIVMGPTY